ncbi:hypothetical protein TNCV_3022631 [Trichonephila clavipes]|nr:hypothetical protein TNCV_3022631 [Trichonephila clavipes]
MLNYGKLTRTSPELASSSPNLHTKKDFEPLHDGSSLALEIACSSHESINMTSNIRSLFRYTMAFGKGTYNFEPLSNDEDDTSIPPRGRRLSPERLIEHQADRQWY